MGQKGKNWAFNQESLQLPLLAVRMQFLCCNKKLHLLLKRLITTGTNYSFTHKLQIWASYHQYDTEVSVSQEETSWWLVFPWKITFLRKLAEKLWVYVVTNTQFLEGGRFLSCLNSPAVATQGVFSKPPQQISTWSSSFKSKPNDIPDYWRIKWIWKNQPIPLQITQCFSTGLPAILPLK